MLKIEVDTAQLNPQLSRINRRIQARLLRVVKRTLKWLDEDQQVGTYTQDAGPPKPPDSEYIRTFDLQNSRGIEITRTRLPHLEGVWFTDIDYDVYVIGDLQAAIHEGRWKTKEEIEGELPDKMTEFTFEELGDLF